MNTNTGTLHSEVDNGPKLPPDWPRVAVGMNIKFRGWWWKVTEIRQDGIVIKPKTRTKFFKLKKKGKKR